MSPERIESTASVTRRISETTCAARRRIRSSASESRASRSSTSRKVCTPSAAAAVSHSLRRLAYWPSLSEWWVRVSTTRSSTPFSRGSQGICWVVQSRQSISRACAARPRSEIVWSMPPVGAQATSRSARMQIVTRPCRISSSGSTPAASHAASAVAHSSAAELDSPAPTGTRLSTTMSMPGAGSPVSRMAHTTPATYAAHPWTWPGPSCSSGALKPLSCCRLVTVRIASARGAAAA